MLYLINVSYVEAVRKSGGRIVRKKSYGESVLAMTCGLMFMWFEDSYSISHVLIYDMETKIS